MDEAVRRTLRFVAVQLVFVAAFLHVAMGVAEWYKWFDAGFLYPRYDDLWAGFILSGCLILVGLYRAAGADDRRPYYLAGIGAMAFYAVGYFFWHLIGHPRQFLTGSPRLRFEEQVGLQWFVDHATAGLLEFVALASEAMAIVLLAILYVEAGRSAPRNEGDDGAEAETESAASE